MTLIPIEKHKNMGAIPVLGDPTEGFHFARVWNDPQETHIRTPVDIGIWSITGNDYNGLPALQGYEFDPELFTAEQAKAWLIEHKIKFEDWAFTKAENAAGDLSHEYLLKFYQLVQEHPSIFTHIKESLHKQARASAGGQLRPRGEFVKSENSAEIVGDIIETDEYYDVPTVFCKEGVFSGSNGIPTLKKYEALRDSAPWFLGTPITPQHILTDTVRPTDRRLGHITSVTARDDRRDIFGNSRFFKKHLNADEHEKIRNLQFPGGSPGYFVPIKSENGQFGGKDYQAIEDGPYVWTEYATFFNGTKAACGRDQNCGPFQNSAAEIDEMMAAPPSLTLVDGNVRKRGQCLKRKNAGDIDFMEADELKKILNESIKGAIGPLTERIDALEKQKNEMALAVSEIKPLAEDPVIVAMAETVKQLNAALPDIKAFKATQEAAKLAVQREAFAKHLNAAHTTDGKPEGEEFEKVWNAASADPLGRDVWLANHPEVKLAAVQERQFYGKITNSGGAAFDLDAERAAHREKTGQVI